MKIAVSYLKSKYDVKKTIELINKSNADYIHVDLMDGIFVKNNNLQIEETIENLKNHIKPLNIHLMVEKPIPIIEKLSVLKSETIVIHFEIPNFLDSLIKLDELKIKKGLAINPDTDVLKLRPFLEQIDEVLIMSVYPGKGGQTFIKETLNKLKWLKKYKDENGLNFNIAVDGGINDETVFLIRDYVDIVISGSFICMHDDYNKQIKLLAR